MATKICTKCHKGKDRDSDFVSDRKSPDGRNYWCKACVKDYQAANKERIREKAHEHYLKNLDAELAYQRERNLLNRSQKAEYNRAYRSRNAAKIRELGRRWGQKNRDKKAAIDNARRAAKRRGGRYTVEEWMYLCLFFSHRCVRCGCEARLTADHVVPLALGGLNTIDNIQPLCRPCNSSKHTKMHDYRPEWTLGGCGEGLW